VAQQEDWSSQLKKIEREFDGLPPEPSLAMKKLQSEEERRAQERVQQRSAMFGGGARLVLVFALFVALAVWPYERSCGVGLFEYLGVELVIIVGGLWVALTTWRYRLPKMHTLSLLIVLTGLILLAVEVLPRIGYAAVDPKHPARFSCPATPAAPATSPTTSAAPNGASPTAVVGNGSSAAALMSNGSPMTAAPQNALPASSEAEQRIQVATSMMKERWYSRTEELAKTFRPQRAALARIERPELLSQPAP
jgi:hypothetical protein